jgi:hypothetical protein
MQKFADDEVVCNQPSDTFEDHTCSLGAGCTYISEAPEEWGSTTWTGIRGLFCESTGNDFSGVIYGNHTICSCHCGDMVDVKSPSVLTTTLSYLAQSLVTTIVGLNMGFRCVIINAMLDFKMVPRPKC